MFGLFVLFVSTRGGVESLSSRPRWRPPRGRRPVAVSRPPAAFDAAEACREQASNEHAACLAVPATEVRSGKELSSLRSFRYASLEALFPGVGVAFESYDFRCRLREAGRLDLADASPLISDQNSSVQGSWRRASYERLTAVLSEVAPTTTGEHFLLTLAGLGLDDDDDDDRRKKHSCHTGNWMDIVGVRNRKLEHSWHQDAQGDARQLTVMLAFPSEDWDPNEGSTGIFSHVIRLSHELKSSGPVKPRDFHRHELPFTDDLIIRPLCKRGQEILVYSDAMTLHSAPDVAHRDSLWRIM